MSRQFDAAVDVGLEIERELRALTPDRPSLRCFIAECLARGEDGYEAVEQVKERLTDVTFSLHSGCGAFIRDLARQMLTGRITEPPAKGRVGSLFFSEPVKKSSAGDRQAVVNMQSLSHEQRAFAVS